MADVQVLRQRRGLGTPHDPVRSVRISEEVWTTAQRRADTDGMSISMVIRLLTQGYAEGQIPVPTLTLTYRESTGMPAN
jgi:antitoxin component of RelBE/YafQ-DinJ toxin-antitoxin module